MGSLAVQLVKDRGSHPCRLTMAIRDHQLLDCCLFLSDCVFPGSGTLGLQKPEAETSEAFAQHCGTLRLPVSPAVPAQLLPAHPGLGFALMRNVINPEKRVERHGRGGRRRVGEEERGRRAGSRSPEAQDPWDPMRPLLRAERVM